MHRLLFLLVLCVPVSAQSLQAVESGGVVGVFKGSGVLLSSVMIPSTVTYGTTTVEINVADNPRIGHVQVFGGNEILRIRDVFTGDTWFKVSAVADQGTHWRYAAIVMAGTKGVSYSAGFWVASYGVSFEGFINHVLNQSNQPYMQFSTHESNFTSNDENGTLILTERIHLGNLNSTYGLSSQVFGMGLGKYGVSGQKWLSVDEANGLRSGVADDERIRLSGGALRLQGTPAFSDGAAVEFYRENTEATVSSIFHSIDPAVLSGHTLLIKAEPVSGLGTGIEIQSRAPSNTPAEIHLRTNIGNMDRTSLLIDDEGVTVTTTQGVFSPPELTTTQRDALPSTTKPGIIFNKSTGKYQGRVSGGWVDLH